MAKKAPEKDVAEKKPGEYRVLARKYRPRNFAELKGQDALVRTLTNAISTGRLAHAFMLTGVRGVGKTTTARIIARALNCEKGPTPDPCGACEQCVSITSDRHIDVLEMDAASRTGVDDIRDIIDSVQYAPASGRYKIFIIDEVHMLSKNAFNALLKTLEEPPENVKFILATTDIRKVPVTVLSRCQRFDLRRIAADVLEKLFADIAGKEKVPVEKGAISLIARAADGSARDGLSLLDQAMSREPDGVTEEQVRGMLGLADRSVTAELFAIVMKGDAPTALSKLEDLYNAGADPLTTLQDLLELTHAFTCAKVDPDGRDVPDLAKELSVPSLAKAWQILLKGASEVQQALHPRQALEMVLIRLMYASDQPSPGDVLKQLKDGSTVSMGSGAPSLSGAPRGATIMRAHSSAAVALSEPQTQISVSGFKDVVALFGQKKEALLQAHLMNDVHLVKFAAGHLELRPTEAAPRNLAGKIAEKLSDWTGQRWIVSLSREEGQPTLASVRHENDRALMAEVQAHPNVAEVVRIFPGAKIIDIKKGE